MVQAVENWCCVSGTIDDLDREGANTRSSSDQAVLSIRVGTVKPITGYPALLRAEDSNTIPVVVRRSQLGNDRAAGKHVTIPIRVAGPDRYFAHPDWSLAHGSLMCGAN